MAEGKTPIAFFTAAALLAAASPLGETLSLPEEELEDLLLLPARLPKTPPKTAPTITTTSTGTPIFIQLLVRFFMGMGVIYPEDSL